jgi:hypothetical protein
MGKSETPLFTWANSSQAQLKWAGHSGWWPICQNRGQRSHAHGYGDVGRGGGLE